MKNISQKLAIILVVLVFSMGVSGSALFAQEGGAGSLIAASDLAFVETNFNGGEYQFVAVAWDVGSLITFEDLSFIKAVPIEDAKRYPVTSGRREINRNLEGRGVITEADYRYLIAGM